MSKIKPKRAFAAEHFQQFGGRGQSILSADRKATDMENFRILPDGSLKKRTGFRTYRQFPNTIRAYWEGSIALKPYVFVVSQESIYRIDAVTGAGKVIDTLNSSYGRIDFFLFEDALYIPDDYGLRVYDAVTDTFPLASPYVPLYGKNWDPTNCGSVNEPLNLFTNHIRIKYANTTSQTVFRLPFFANAIDSVRVGGTEIQSYDFVSGSNTFSIPAEFTGYSVEVGLEIMLDEDRLGIRSANKSVIYPGRHHPTLCLYDSQSPYRIYCSSYVSGTNLSASRAVYPDSLPLYFKESNVLLAGDAQYPVTAICHFGSRLLAYSTRCTWEITCPDDAGDEVDISLLLPDTGCTAPNSAIVCNSHPVIINKKGIFLLELPRSDEEKPTLTRISDDTSDLLTASLTDNCIAREEVVHNELWIRDPNDTNARMLVYNYLLGQWYVFGNFNATLFVDLPDLKGFTDDNKLVKLDDSVYTDNYGEITAYYQSGYFDFSHPEEKKRSLRATVCKSTPSASVFLKLETESAERTFELPESEAGKPDVFDARALMGRFRYLRFRILLSGKKDCRIHSLSFYANL